MPLNNQQKNLRKLGWIELQDLGRFLSNNEKKKIKVPAPPRGMNIKAREKAALIPENTRAIRLGKQDQTENSLLKKAFQDLDEELRQLHADKTQLERKETELGAKLNQIQTEEIDLRNRISELMREEADQEKKKAKLGEQISKADKKIEKVYSIRRRLEEV